MTLPVVASTVAIAVSLDVQLPPGIGLLRTADCATSKVEAPLIAPASTSAATPEAASSTTLPLRLFGVMSCASSVMLDSFFFCSAQVSFSSLPKYF